MPNNTAQMETAGLTVWNFDLKGLFFLTMQSTSGVKARGASASAKPSLGAGAGAGTKGRGGAADRAEERFETEAAANNTPGKYDN